MEYRGYDSAGVAVLTDHKLMVAKSAGKISALEAKLKTGDLSGFIGLGHTRWATHGEPNENNAHPHIDNSGQIVIVHNGIIENYLTLKKQLKGKGHTFQTETDTEVLAHLIGELYDGNIEEAVRLALSQVNGTYGLAVMCLNEPGKLIAARLGSPLVIGIGHHENFIASDVAAIVDYTRNVIYLDDGEIAVVSENNVTYSNLEKAELRKNVERISFEREEIEKGGYPHFMLKEINEQPSSIADAMRGRLLQEEGNAKLGGLLGMEKELHAVRRIVVLGCGTSWHAGLVSEYIFEELAGVPVEVEYASEFRYRNPVIEAGTISLSISQSGETLDTLEAMRESRRRGALPLGVVNVVGSTIARETQAGVYIHAGPEIGVASTKAFTSQIVVLTLIALKIARAKGRISKAQGQQLVQDLRQIPEKVQQILSNPDPIIKIAEKFVDSRNFLYLGRGINFPVALEGALKLKEISYIHAEGYPAAEMKHGPIALIDENMPVVFIAVNSSTYEKVISNMTEVRARKGVIIAIATEGDTSINRLSDHVIRIPETNPLLIPLLTVIPLQLLAYHIAVLRGCDVDQPRNLAKSVTVE